MALRSALRCSHAPWGCSDLRLTLDEVGHAGDRERQFAVFWGVDQALRDQAGAGRTQAARLPTESGRHRAGGAVVVAVLRHCPQVGLLGARGPVPASAEEADV